MTAPKTTDKPSSKHHVVDHRFATILEDDFRTPAVTILDALEGEPKKGAIAILTWATEKTDDPARALAAWARKHNKGRCRRAAHPADKPQRRHAGHTERPRDDRADDGRGSGPPRTGGIDPAFVRANVERMAD